VRHRAASDCSVFRVGRAPVTHRLSRLIALVILVNPLRGAVALESQVRVIDLIPAAAERRDLSELRADTCRQSGDPD